MGPTGEAGSKEVEACRGGDVEAGVQVILMNLAEIGLLIYPGAGFLYHRYIRAATYIRAVSQIHQSFSVSQTQNIYNEYIYIFISILYARHRVLSGDCILASGDQIRVSGDYLDVIPATNVDEKSNIGDSFIILCRLAGAYPYRNILVSPFGNCLPGTELLVSIQEKV